MKEDQLIRKRGLLLIPNEHLTAKGEELKPDTHDFLNKVLINLLRSLAVRGINTKDCNFLGTNDILVYRSSSAVFVVFSRSTRDYTAFFTELTLPEDAEDEELQGGKQTETDVLGEEGASDVPELLDTATFLKTMEQSYDFVDPIAVGFPDTYLSLQNEEESEKAAKAVAELLVEPTLEDVDQKNRIVRANPIFQGRDFLLDPDLIFVLMEFKEPYKSIYEGLIKSTVEEEGFRCIKSDDIFSTTAVIEDIWENLNKAALVISEITTNNPNVMYELGICHTIGKNVMMLTQDTSSIPFNFRHMRVYGYSNDIPGSNELRDNIRSVLRHIRTTTGSSISPTQG